MLKSYKDDRFTRQPHMMRAFCPGIVSVALWKKMSLCGVHYGILKIMYRSLCETEGSKLYSI